MTTPIPPTYKGKSLPPLVESLLKVLIRHNFTTDASTTHAGKTINIRFNNSRCGYINSAVLGSKGVIGYHFAAWGRASNDCPRKHFDTLAEDFCRRYGCAPNDVLVQTGGGSNAGRRYLVILNATVALHVLRTDASLPSDGDLYLVRQGDLYVEGQIRDVRMQRLERSAAARQACLDYYGYDCYICKVNLRQSYKDLLHEVIHVHHEEPLAVGKGPRKVDPVADLKPVCPNCHAVIHSRTDAYSIEEVIEMLRCKT